MRRFFEIRSPGCPSWPKWKFQIGNCNSIIPSWYYLLGITKLIKLANGKFKRNLQKSLKKINEKLAKKFEKSLDKKFVNTLNCSQADKKISAHSP